MSTVYPAVPDLEAPERSYSLLRCGGCGLGLTDPYVTADTVPALYHESEPSDYEFPQRNVVGALKDAFARRRIRNITRDARIEPCRVLDFGTGAGRYAAAAKRVHPDATVAGADFAESPPEGSYYSDGTPLQYLSYARLRESEERYDLIVARHVLEHVHDPVRLVRWWLSMISSSGVIYVEVPNFRSRTGRLIGTCWPLWYVPKHVSHFTKDALARTLEIAGGRADLGRTEMPLMGNVLALKTGHSRFDPRFRLPGLTLHPLQCVIEALAREGSCLTAIVRPMVSRPV